MKYDVVQQSLEEYLKSNWDLTEIQYDNVAFNSELYHEYLRCNVRFGDGLQTSLGANCYRQIGLLILSVFTKPATGSARKLELASLAAELITPPVIVRPELPLVAPKVVFRAPEFMGDDTERNGWVMAQVRSAFHYDWEK